MAWRRPGDKPLYEAMLVSLLTRICTTRPQWDKSTDDALLLSIWPVGTHSINIWIKMQQHLYSENVVCEMADSGFVPSQCETALFCKKNLNWRNNKTIAYLMTDVTCAQVCMSVYCLMQYNLKQWHRIFNDYQQWEGLWEAMTGIQTITLVLENMLTYWGRVTHKGARKLTNIGSDNGLSPGQHKAITEPMLEYC